VGLEVGWHLRLSQEDALTFIVQARVAPNVDDAAFVAGGWSLAWEQGPEEGLMTARLVRNPPRR